MSKQSNRRRNKNQEKKPEWPKKEKLKEAVDVVYRFQQMCKHQLDHGHWATMDFPSKHHINKILSIQYMEHDFVSNVYGPGLLRQVKELIPVCRAYIEFVKDYEYDVEKNETRQVSRK